MTNILVVDNHDSFVHTLVGYLHQLGAQTRVVEADALHAADVADLVERYDGVMISPGPGRPEEAGASIAVVRECAKTQTPLLGVCLGHQAIAVAFGGAVGQAAELKHGMVSSVAHTGTGVFEGLPSPLAVGRYHSLAVDASSVPNELEVTATTPSGTIMAIQHREHPIFGVQFHPESVLTEHGYDLLAAWLEAAGLHGARERARTLAPVVPVHLDHRGINGTSLRGRPQAVANAPTGQPTSPSGITVPAHTCNVTVVPIATSPT